MDFIGFVAGVADVVCNWAAWLSVDAQDELRADSTCQKGCMSYDLKGETWGTAWAACDIPYVKRQGTVPTPYTLVSRGENPTSRSL